MVVHRTDTVPIEKLRIAVTDSVAPVMAAISQPFETLADSFSGIKTMRQLKAENIRLKAENDRLQQWYDAALKYQAQNKSLQDLLNVKTDPALSFVTTRVVSDPGGSFVKSVLLPVGNGDNVSKGNAVMSGRGLIGRITEVGERSSRVLLITDLNSRIPVIIQNTRTHAILAGKNTGVLRLERLPIDSSLTVGQRIVTSGDGGQLPPDIPIGTITEVGASGISVQPLADIETVTYVQVINAQMDRALMTGEITPAAPPKHGKR
jgi:rod shape-determining protein MreC